MIWRMEGASEEPAKGPPVLGSLHKGGHDIDMLFDLEAQIAEFMGPADEASRGLLENKRPDFAGERLKDQADNEST